MTDKKLRAIHEGQLKILDKILPCAVLEDGTRIIGATAIFTAFDRPQRGDRAQDKEIKLPSFIASKALLPYITQEVQEQIRLIEYLDVNNKLKKGYRAEILPQLCDIYLQAKKDKVLSVKQVRLAEISEIMVRSLAKVGIAALVDEATGYQNVRSKDALQIILDKYLLKEFATWSKRFPDDFYRQMFRLKSWDIDKLNFTKRPGVVGKYTKDIVYDRLAPCILKELEERNPKDTKGNRKHKHHQFLTDDIGHPALSQHLHTVIAFMKAATSWDSFQRMLARALPKKNEQLLFDIKEEE